MPGNKASWLTGIIKISACGLGGELQAEKLNQSLSGFLTTFLSARERYGGEWRSQVCLVKLLCHGWSLGWGILRAEQNCRICCLTGYHYCLLHWPGIDTALHEPRTAIVPPSSGPLLILVHERVTKALQEATVRGGYASLLSLVCHRFCAHGLISSFLWPLPLFNPFSSSLFSNVSSIQAGNETRCMNQQPINTFIFKTQL